MGKEEQQSARAQLLVPETIEESRADTPPTLPRSQSAPKVSLPRLFDGFLLAKEAQGVKGTTLETYRVMYRSLVSFFPVERLEDANTITQQNLNEWVVSLSNYATATRDQRITKAKVFFAWCQREGFLEGNPSQGLKRPKKDWQPDPLSEDEIKRFLAESKRGSMGIRNYALCCFLLDSGIRNSELCSLLADELSLKTGQIRVRKSKGGKSRTVIVGKRSRDALWRWLMVRPEDSKYLFCTQQGEKLSQVGLRVIVSKIGKRAGIRAYPHRLRHTFALLYLKAGGDPYTLQYLLGHEDMAVTREYVKIAARDASQLYRSPLDALE